MLGKKKPPPPAKPKERVELVDVEDLAVEWFKNPKFVEEYEALEEEFAEFDREIDARIARQKRWGAVVAWLRGVVAKVRGFWGHITRGGGRVL